MNNQKSESCANNELYSSNKSIAVNNTDVSAQKQPKPRQKYLHCVSCNSPFSNAWDLMVHVQAAHMMNIYQLADSNKLQQQVKYQSPSKYIFNEGNRNFTLSLINVQSSLKKFLGCKGKIDGGNWQR